jgi:hypothetical protein
MTKNLKTADTIVKLILAITVLVSYFTGQNFSGLNHFWD